MKSVGLTPLSSHRTFSDWQAVLNILMQRMSTRTFKNDSCRRLTLATEEHGLSFPIIRILGQTPHLRASGKWLAVLCPGACAS